MSGAAESIVAKFGILLTLEAAVIARIQNPAWDLAFEAADILSSEVRGHDFLPCPGSYKVIKLSERFPTVHLRLPVRQLSHKLCRVVIQWGRGASSEGQVLVAEVPEVYLNQSQILQGAFYLSPILNTCMALSSMRIGICL